MSAWERSETLRYTHTFSKALVNVSQVIHSLSPKCYLVYDLELKRYDKETFFDSQRIL